MELTDQQRQLDAKLWWTTVRPWLATMTSWPSQHMTLWKCQRCGRSVAAGQKLCNACKKLDAKLNCPRCGAECYQQWIEVCHDHFWMCTTCTWGED